ncbi:hypothetical protein GCM10025857_14320 [Alicyclobacillus contaminans]|nr:hypothetical protein GCM10025857_14320 [Alicyclobacillus contaminans]
MRRTIWRMATLAVAAAAVGTGVLYAHERHPAGSSGSAWLGTLPRTANESSSTLPEGPVVLNNATTNAVGHVAGKKASGGAAPSTASTERGGSKDVSSASAHSTASPSGAATTAPKPAASGSGASGGTTTHAAKGAASGASAGQTGEAVARPD